MKTNKKKVSHTTFAFTFHTLALLPSFLPTRYTTARCLAEEDTVPYQAVQKQYLLKDIVQIIINLTMLLLFEAQRRKKLAMQI